MSGLLGAIAFLTRIPARGGNLANSVKWFPVVGLLIGASAGAVYWVAGASRVSALAPVLAVAMAVAVTGAFHEDGLADTFDGFSSTRSTDRQLEIMQDSRLGTFGVSALALVLTARVILVAGLTPGWNALVLLAWAHGVSRAAVIGVMTVARPAGEGLGVAYLAGLRRVPPLGIAGLVAAAGWWVIDDPWSLITIGVGPLAVWGWAHRRIGGVTGDVLGACQQLALVGALVAVSG